MGHRYSTYVQFAYLKEDGVFDLRKIFDLRKFFAVPKNFLKSKIHCTQYDGLSEKFLNGKIGKPKRKCNAEYKGWSTS